MLWLDLGGPLLDGHVLTGFLAKSHRKFLFLPMTKFLGRNRIRRQAASHRRNKGLGLRMGNGVGSFRDLSACYVTVATQVPGMQKLDATP